MPNNNQGRGWHGDSAGHARAGKKGGRASSRNKKVVSDKVSNITNLNDYESNRMTDNSSMSDDI